MRLAVALATRIESQTAQSTKPATICHVSSFAVVTHTAGMKRILRCAVLSLALLACGDSLPVGEADEASTIACEAYGASAEDVVASDDESGASALTLHPNTAYRIMTSGDGYATLHVPEGHHDYALFIDSGRVSSTVLGLTGQSKAGACPGSNLRDVRTHVHEAGEYVLHFSRSGEGSMFFYAVPIAAMFTPDGGTVDGAMHMHDGGAHDATMHDGAAHDHDAGAHDGGAHDAAMHDATHDAGAHDAAHDAVTHDAMHG